MLRLRELREEKGLTQSEVATRLGIATSSIGMYEQGRRTPSPKLLLKMSLLFDANVDYILGNSSIRLHPSAKRATTIHSEEVPDDFVVNEMFKKLSSDEEGKDIIKKLLKEKIAEISLPYTDVATIRALSEMISTMKDGEIKAAKLEIIKAIIEIDFRIEQLVGLSSFINSFKSNK